MKCSNCTGSITVDKNATVDGFRFCSHSEAALNVELLETILMDALD